MADIKYNFSKMGQSSFAIVKDKVNGDRLYGWGKNDWATLGIGKRGNQSLPQLCIGLPEKATINFVVSGDNVSLVSINNNQIYLAGANNRGQMGQGTTGDYVTTFTLNKTLSDKGTIDLDDDGMPKVAIGNAQILVVINNELWVWGRNDTGQVGNGTESNGIYVPTKIELPVGRIKQVDATQYNSYAWIDNSIYAWGTYESGGLGIAGVTENQLKPVLVPFSSEMKGNITSFSVGSLPAISPYFSACALKIDDNKLFAWGRNDNSMFGMSTTPLLTPTSVKSPLPEKVVSNFMVVGDTTAIEIDNKLYMAGNGDKGTLCNGTNANQSSYLEIKNYVSNSSTKYYNRQPSMVANTDGLLHAWGDNTLGTFGIGTNEAINSSPVLMDAFSTPTINGFKDTNNQIVAADALNDIWDGTTLNQINLAKYVNLNLPTADTTFAITPDTIPVADNTKRTITLSLTASAEFYHAYPDGQKITGSTPNEIIITGFKALPVTTDITAKTIANKDMVVVDKWLSTVANADGTVKDSDRLKKYLNLQNLPSDAILVITIQKTNYASGVLEFKIKTNKITNSENGQETYDYEFNIILDLIPRITKMTPITKTPSTSTIEQFKNDLFVDDNTVGNINLLKEYVNIIAPVDNVMYKLVPGSWNADGGDGILGFKIYASKYYGTDGYEKTGSATDALSVVTFSNLQFKQSASSITLKTNYPTAVRVDKFIDYLKDGGTTLNRTKLAEFFDLKNVPSSAMFSIDGTPVIDDFNENDIKNKITFKLKTSAYNNVDGVPDEDIQKFTLTLGDYYAPTDITVKTTYDHTLRVDKVANKLEELTGDALVNYLKNFVTLKSIPSTAIVSINSVVTTEATGELTFNVVLNQKYIDSDDQLATGTYTYPISLALGIKHEPTAIVLKDDYKSNIRVDKFISEISVLSGQKLYDYLATDYVDFTSIVNITALTVEIMSSNFNEGIVELQLSVASYYNEDSELINTSKVFTLDLILARKYTPTSIKTLDVGKYPQDLTPTKFKYHIEKDAASNPDDSFNLNHTSITFLSKFLVFSSIPNNTDYKLVWGNANEVEGTLDFSLVLTQYYNTDGDLILTASDPFKLTLNLSSSSITVPKATEIKTKTDSPIVESNDDFMNQIFIAENVINRDALGSFITGLHTVPSTADITLVKHQDTINGILSYTIHISAYYNGIDSNSITEAKSYSFEVKTKDAITNDTKTESQFPWWWILVAIGGVTLISLLTWWIIKKQKNKELTI